MANDLDYSRKFAQSLKTYGCIDYRPNPNETSVVSIHGVTLFIKKESEKKCNPASINYESSINLNDVSDELFVVGEVWLSRDTLLYPTMEEHAKLHGFNIVKVQTSIYCNRRGKGGILK